MCGITGIFAFNPIGRMNLVHLEAATRALEKRGPDAQDSWFDDVVGLGHRRLSVIDTSSAANQPMVDASGRYRIVFNGEIYNFRALRKSLESVGYSFRTDSDTEVLLQSYIHWGDQILERLNGFFALAIYDSEEEILFLARDRYGIKPLLVFQDDNHLLFASEMKSLLAYGFERKLNKEALNLYFQLTYVPAPLSIMEGVQKVQPGHVMKVEKGEVVTRKYYDFPYQERSVISDLDQAKDELIKRLSKSVEDRLVADVPLGAFLSGGIDSSVIVGLASQKVADLNTFSIGFKDNKYFDETKYAELVAKKFNTNHHVFSLSNDDLLNAVNDAVGYLDEPFADSSALPVYILSQKTREHATVALSGDGADELFSGYNKHKAWLMTQHKTLKSSFIGGLGSLWNQLPQSRNNAITDTFRKLDRFAKAQKMNLRDRYWYLATFTSMAQVERLLLDDQKNGESELKNQLLSGITTGDLNEVLALDCQLVLPGDMLTKVDLMSMANGLEVRVPFLDAAVVDFAFQLDSSLKANGNEKKIVLREAFRSLLPEELYHRPKHGFEVPLLDWFRKDLKGELDKVVFNEQVVQEQNLFDWNEIARIKRKLFSSNPGDSHILVWSLFVFQKWYFKFLVS
ncbi:MAG: asparagine synthase (glutamine-hydrolyzing) [Cyclobacteriaceae bacterium]